MKLFVGLGNPGDEYAGNRHNVGFMAVDRIAAAHGFPAWRKRFQGVATEADLGGERVILLKPQTYMNESGRAVGEACRFLKIPEGDVVVLYDEIDLAPGKLKVKTGGGNAGHNGLRSISAHLGNDYVRVRIGVGHPGSKDAVVHWVLRDFAKADRDWLEPLLDAIAGAAPRLAKGDQSRFMTDVAKALDGDQKADEKDGEDRARDEREPKRSTAKRAASPEGERASKRQGALADNLRNWLAGRRRGDRD